MTEELNLIKSPTRMGSNIEKCAILIDMTVKCDVCGKLMSFGHYFYHKLNMYCELCAGKIRGGRK
jgi:hypothetical protein